MPDTRRHRGLAPEDAQSFSADVHPRLRQATQDLSWLLTRSYAVRSATELVGNRYDLSSRQRLAVARCACSDEHLRDRRRRELRTDQIAGEELWIDGLNVLTALEVALSGGVILLGRDGCCRDIAGVHRQYRDVEETSAAIVLVSEMAAVWQVGKCSWWLDRPVSNTGRLKHLILDIAASRQCDWEVELVYSPDAVLARTEHVVATSDSVILDRCQRWHNLVRAIMDARISASCVVDLSRPPSSA